MSLAQTISMSREQIQKRLRVGRAHWDALIAAVEQAESVSGRECYDEQLWTFVLACAYGAVEGGPSNLASRLAGTSMGSEYIWFEVLPRSPRRMEGQSNLDLALGDLALRPGTESGIELLPGAHREVVFCEFKWYSDIAYSVSASRHRNQLARVIENALLLRDPHGAFAERVHVCLITPRIFKERGAPSRLYWYKWEEYTQPGRVGLLADLRDCGLILEDGLPDVQERLDNLSLSWLSYEDLLFAAPASPIRDALIAFYATCKGPELLKWDPEENSTQRSAVMQLEG